MYVGWGFEHIHKFEKIGKNFKKGIDKSASWGYNNNRLAGAN